MVTVKDRSLAQR